MDGRLIKFLLLHNKITPKRPKTSNIIDETLHFNITEAQNKYLSLQMGKVYLMTQNLKPHKTDKYKQMAGHGGRHL